MKKAVAIILLVISLSGCDMLPIPVLSFVYTYAFENLEQTAILIVPDNQPSWSEFILYPQKTVKVVIPESEIKYKCAYIDGDSIGRFATYSAKGSTILTFSP